MDTMIPYFLFFSLLTEAILVSGFPYQYSWEDGNRMSKRAAGPGAGSIYDQQEEPTGTFPGSASSNSQQGGYGGTPPFYPHGQPTDPNASLNSQQGGHGGPPPFGPHGQPTYPNASSNSGSSGLVYPGVPAGPDGGPPQSQSFGPQGQPIDPNASSNSGSSSLVYPGVSAGPDGRPDSGYTGWPLGPDGLPPHQFA